MHRALLALLGLAQVAARGAVPRPVEAQAREVDKVKRSASGVIVDPVTLGPSETIGAAKAAMARHNVSGFPVVEGGSAGARAQGRLVGILTRRDLKWTHGDDSPVRDVMTSESLVTASPNTTLEDANRILSQNKVAKLLLAGGGLKHHGAYGVTDELSKKIIENPVSVPDFHATIHAALGINPAHELFAGSRPVPITDHGQPVEALFT